MSARQAGSLAALEYSPDHEARKRAGVKMSVGGGNAKVTGTAALGGRRVSARAGGVGSQAQLLLTVYWSRARRVEKLSVEGRGWRGCLSKGEGGEDVCRRGRAKMSVDVCGGGGKGGEDVCRGGWLPGPSLARVANASLLHALFTYLLACNSPSPRTSRPQDPADCPHLGPYLAGRRTWMQQSPPVAHACASRGSRHLQLGARPARAPTGRRDMAATPARPSLSRWSFKVGPPGLPAHGREGGGRGTRSQSTGSSRGYYHEEATTCAVACEGAITLG